MVPRLLGAFPQPSSASLVHSLSLACEVLSLEQSCPNLTRSTRVPRTWFSQLFNDRVIGTAVNSELYNYRPSHPQSERQTLTPANTIVSAFASPQAKPIAGSIWMVEPDLPRPEFQLLPSEITSTNYVKITHHSVHIYQVKKSKLTVT